MAGTGLRCKWIVALLVCLPLAACGERAPDQPTGAKTSAAGAKKAKVKDNMVAAVPSGKSSTAVSVFFVLGTAPAIDSALPIDVSIVPREDFISLQARFSTQSDGLTLISGDLIAPIADAKAESTIDHKLVLMPKKEGVYMVTVNLETESEDGSVSRIFSIPVIVAPPGATSAATASPAAQN